MENWLPTLLSLPGCLQLLDGLRAILKVIEAEGDEGAGDDSVLIERLVELAAPARATQSATAKSRVPAVRVAVQTASAPPAAVTSAVAVVLPAPEPAAPAPQAPASAAPVPAADSQKPRAAAMGSAAESTLRVDIALLNRMMNLVGELVLTRNQVLQATAADPNMTLLSRRLDMVTADLREAVMKARMQPVSNVFSKMPRMVRDLSQALGRRVRLQMEGQETELDKSLLEAIKDPLTHAVRNSLDHGIESPDVREAAGKDPEGLLTLRAVQEGSHVIIEISDDGAGIAVEKVRSKAIERGLVTAERAAQLGEREILQLVFLARVLHGRPGHQCERPRRGHGRCAHQCREDRRQGRDRLAPREGNHSPPAHSPHAGHHSRADRAQCQPELRAPAGRALRAGAPSPRAGCESHRVD